MRRRLPTAAEVWGEQLRRAMHRTMLPDPGVRRLQHRLIAVFANREQFMVVSPHKPGRPCPPVAYEPNPWFDKEYPSGASQAVVEGSPLVLEGIAAVEDELGEVLGLGPCPR